MKDEKKFPYVGHENFESYRKELNARKLYAEMDRLGYSPETQRAIMTGDYSVAAIPRVVEVVE